MPLPFNKTLDLKLLDLVKDNHILYNPHHPKYQDFDSREVIWQRIGDTLGRPAAVCKARWINMRDMMRRKIKDRLRNPHQPRYHYKYEDQMAFLVPFFKEPSTTEYPELLEDFQLQDTIQEDRETKYKRREYDTQELNPADPIDVFLMSIGGTLRNFSPYYLNQAKSKIFQVVQDFELQQIVDKGDPEPSDR
ncbi:uncharacterized protein LOC121736340 [Aricia agestis]|uniref:uncharacterized protein LOC121736340 n=1 Tax=Aricia agestis TaxID=91739 RepID=UPI001C20665D|nr:uncharacterized protein LOC121736340 [Aricia agestis]